MHRNLDNANMIFWSRGGIFFAHAERSILDGDAPEKLHDVMIGRIFDEINSNLLHVKF